jgi:hypothetical protein
LGLKVIASGAKILVRSADCPPGCAGACKVKKQAAIEAAARPVIALRRFMPEFVARRCRR